MTIEYELVSLDHRRYLPTAMRSPQIPKERIGKGKGPKQSEDYKRNLVRKTHGVGLELQQEKRTVCT